MKLSERLNFSTEKPENDSAIEIQKSNHTDFTETLLHYCSANNISIADQSDYEFFGCVDIMKNYGQSDKSAGSYWFWID